jgi:hypothetical protein
MLELQTMWQVALCTTAQDDVTLEALISFVVVMHVSLALALILDEQTKLVFPA